jgi:hypothetical protein
MDENIPIIFPKAPDTPDDEPDLAAEDAVERKIAMASRNNANPDLNLYSLFIQPKVYNSLLYKNI